MKNSFSLILVPVFFFSSMLSSWGKSSFSKWVDSVSERLEANSDMPTGERGMIEAIQKDFLKKSLSDAQVLHLWVITKHGKDNDSVMSAWDPAIRRNPELIFRMYRLVSAKDKEKLIQIFASISEMTGALPDAPKQREKWERFFK